MKGSESIQSRKILFWKEEESGALR